MQRLEKIVNDKKLNKTDKLKLEKQIYADVNHLVYETDTLKKALRLHFFPPMFYSIFRVMQKGFNGTGTHLETHEQNRKNLYTLCYQYGIKKKELPYHRYKLIFKSFMKNPIDRYGRSTFVLDAMLYGGSMIEAHHFLRFYQKDLHKIKYTLKHHKSKLERIILK